MNERMHTDGTEIPTIRMINVTLDLPVYPGQIHHFRKAVAEVVEQDLKLIFEARNIPTWLFHYHDPVTGEPIRSYPLIQYKMYGKGKSRKYIHITGIGQGVDAVKVLLDYLPQRFQCYGVKQPVALRVLGEALESNEQLIQLAEPALYQISNWLPLDKTDHNAWLDNKTAPLCEKIPSLENNLRENIYRLSRASGTRLPFNPEVHITDILKSGHDVILPTGKGDLRFFAMSVRFTTDVVLPPHISLGKGCSMGFGKITAVPVKHAEKSKYKKAESLMEG